MMALANSIFDDDSDSSVDSEDSFVPDEDDLIIPSEGYDSDSNDDTPFGDNPAPPTIHQTVNGRSRGDVSSAMLMQQDDDDCCQPSSSQEKNPQESGGTIQQAGSFYGKKKCFSWNRNPFHPPLCPTASKNVVKDHSSFLEGPALQLGRGPTPVQVWELLFTPNMSQEIIKHTNAKLGEMRKKLKNETSSSYKDMDKEEFDALLAIIFFCSIFKASRECLKSLFSTSFTGRPLFRGIMTEKRCCILFRALRFDDSATRSARAAEDKAACISSIFNEFISNSQQNYSLGPRCTIDETLVPFRGKVSFKMYNANKAAKFGIKIRCLTDTLNAYIYDAYIYTGKGSDGATLTPLEKQKLSIPTQSVIRLTRCIEGTSRNVTCDDSFASVQLAEELLKRGLTMVGTLKKNQPEIPPEFQPSPARAVGSSLYGYTPEMTLLSHITKKNKAMILLSTMHHKPYTNHRNQKPEIICFYDATKCEVDNLDQKCSIYSANRRTRRWPLAVFYHMVAVCSSNAFTLYEMFPDAEAKTRFQFVHDLALGLANAHVQKRLQIPNFPPQLIKTMKEIAGIESSPERSSAPAPSGGKVKSDLLLKRKLCQYCPYQKNRVTRFKCVKCEIPTCGEHSKKLCNACTLLI